MRSVLYWGQFLFRPVLLLYFGLGFLQIFIRVILCQDFRFRLQLSPRVCALYGLLVGVLCPLKVVLCWFLHFFSFISDILWPLVCLFFDCQFLFGDLAVNFWMSFDLLLIKFGSHWHKTNALAKYAMHKKSNLIFTILALKSKRKNIKRINRN